MSHREETIAHADAEFRRGIRDIRSLEARLTQIETILTSPKRQVITKAVVETPPVTETDIHLSGDEKNEFNFFNGTFQQKITAAITEAAGVVTLTVGRLGGGDLTARFTEEYGTLADNSTIAITVGASDAAPQINYIYVLQSDPTTLVKSTSDWPWTVDHIKIARILCPTAAFVSANGVYSFHLWNDEDDDDVFQGHMSHQSDRARVMGAFWDEGVAGNGTSGYLTPTANNVELKATAGVVYQMHRHDIPAFDTSGTDVVLVKNWNGDAYHDITNLYDIVADSGGNPIGATKWFKIVIWGVANLGSSSFHPMMINLPDGFYNTQAACENDADDTIDTTIPDDFRGTGYLIASVVVQRATTWVIGSTKILLGQTAATIGGGGSRYTNAEVEAYVNSVANAGIATGDSLLFTDVGSSGVLKQDLVSDLLALNPVDLLNLNGISTYVHKVSCVEVHGHYLGIAGPSHVEGRGVFHNGTGTGWIILNVRPPQWLVRYCVENSKTLTATTCVLNWDDTDSTDYTTWILIGYSPFDAQAITNKFDDAATNWGSGTTGFRNDTLNFTDTVLRDGDYMEVQMQWSQTTAASCRYKSIEMTYTIT